MENELVYILDTHLENCELQKCKQFDNRPVILKVYDNLQPYNFTNATFSLKAKKPDNTFVIQTNNITVNDNIITINTLDIDIVRVPGIVELEFRILKNSLAVTTFTFKLNVLISVVQAADPGSKNVVTKIEELDQTIEEAEVKRQELITEENNITQLLADNQVVTYTALNPVLKIITAADGTAISTQIAAATTAGYKCVFPHGVTIELTQSILIPSNCDIDFNNCILKRKAGPTNIFDIVKNADQTNGNINIRLKNALIDGNRQADNLNNAVDSNRFSGLKLTKVTGVTEIDNITVINTVNGEELQTTPASGIFYVDCANIKFTNINGWDNMGTAIYNVGSSRCTIDGSLTYNNAGSGISGYGPECKFLNITTYNNGMSNLSVNGVRCIVDNVLTYGSGFSGLNIGHDVSYAYADDTLVSNVHSYNNNYEGITITHSDRVKVVNGNVYGNAIDNSRENIRVYLSNYSKIVNLYSHNCINQGIRFYSGVGHTISNSEFAACSAGVYADSGVSVTIDKNTKIHDNTLDGILLVSASNCDISAETYNNARYGINIAGGSGHIINSNAYNNTTANIIETSPATNVNYNYMSNNNVRFLNNGFAEIKYNKTIPDETTTGIFSVAVPVHARLIIDFLIIGTYPASSSCGVTAVRGVATCAATSTGTMANNVSTTLISSSAVSGVTIALTASLTNDEVNDKVTFNVNQNSEPNDGSLQITVIANITNYVANTLTKPTITLL